ncbi:MBL fold metallo-hydrolase [Aliivibrio sp. S4TY2]|uniref:ComEC/Rec2 family competence protein n=1 Tax=unclassified Aliivibrio TaxID=2645654 RepID=UPI002379D471|nr:MULTISPECIES: MBL fold metallo-hydrolase [unclassified Aliivibrio]MDD9157402.1 MBL fold metallo-hydrolase [Aliivibrio sp. S4TY2]MDD9161404.1 MBL fold metallo-hydrolase [Aliivibrio sp. S4TY1]MDD9165434.1 MBL fold metallo-hydrolase [Aliivibrio sp. S4MY2]MDD9169311.1 MBL fold metallo-hydrolase [Aliivibrio sp. S4MY4]MDD9186304.1 MBL fold metallo-hydrolase [Aliivibrio sp. S4MY3]
MGYEIDILAVGEKSNSGDAIALRYGNLHGNREEQTVVIIDGGYKDDGLKLVEHVKKYYLTEKVDLVISTHPDQDHINGLSKVIEELQVSELWIHQAWEHNEGLSSKFRDGRITDNSIGERLKDNLESAYNLVEQAKAKNIIINEPFTGRAAGSIKVLGPSKEYYEELLVQFDGMPATKSVTDTSSVLGFFESAMNKAVKTMKRLFAIWGEDQLDNEDTTSAKNNSSVITQIIVDGKRLLFTGDAGITALDNAANEIDACTSGASLKFIQIPHHGSKRNVGPDVLNRIIGKPVANGETRPISAIASSAKEGEPKHPHPAVMNAFKHRGISGARATQGLGIRHSLDAPNRPDWNSLSQQPYQYHYDVEA